MTCSKIVEEKVVSELSSDLTSWSLLDSYIEPFGWTGEIILNNKPSALEVFNDSSAVYSLVFKTLQDMNKAKEVADLFENLFDNYNPEEKHYQLCNKIFNAYINADASLENVKDVVNSPLCKEYPALYRKEPDVATTFAVVYGIMCSSHMKPFNAYTDSKIAVFKWGNWTEPRRREARELANLHKRIAQTIIESRDPVECVKTYDSAYALFLINPPRDSCICKQYPTQWTNEDDERLIDVLKGVKGRVILTLDNALYERYKSVKDAGYRLYQPEKGFYPLYDGWNVLIKDWSSK